ncbi:retrovirus-related pol polyprotein from transposon TNT 1-94 [Tanacetum coccineum]
MGTNTANQEKIVHCYNCQGEGHMARQCTKPERPKNSEWFKEKMLLAQALEIGVALDEEHMTFLADDGLTIATGQDTQELTTTAIFQTDDLDAFDSDYDEAPSANAILMAKLPTYDSNVLLEKETEKVVQDTTSFTQQDAIIMSVIEEMSNQVAKCNEHDALSIIDTKETLKLFEESKLKMLAKQNDPIAKEKKVNIAPIDYGALNKLSEHLLSILCLKNNVLKDVPQELPSISVVKHSYLKKRSRLNDFDNIIKVRTKVTDSFTTFDQGLFREITDMKEVFNQMKTEIAKCSVERKYFEIEKKELLIENDHLLEHIICQDVMCIAMHADLDNKCVVPANDNNLAYAEMEQSFIDEYSRCVKLEAELSKKNDMVEKDDAPEFPEFLEINELKAQLRKKKTTISNLKDHIASLKGTSVSDYTVQVNNSCVLALGMYKLDLEPLSPKRRKNREVHVDYLKQTKEHADTFRDIVEQARCNTPK